MIDSKSVPIIGIAYTKKGKKIRVVEDSNLSSVMESKYISLTEVLMLYGKYEVEWIYHNQVQLHKIIQLICENKLRNSNSIGMDTSIPLSKRKSYFYNFYSIVCRTLASPYSDFDCLFAGYKLSDCSKTIDGNILLNYIYKMQ